MTTRYPLVSAACVAVLALSLGGCKTKGDIVVDEGVGVAAVRGACPSVGVPDYTGDITLFKTPGASDVASLDLTAAMTNVRSTCNEASEKVYTTVSFDVLARRTQTAGARTVQLPYFVTVLRGGKAVVSKRVGTVTIAFADGQERAQARAQGGAYIDKSEATLAPEIRARITRKRKAGDSDAAIDPLALPEVKAAVARATFDLLVGFQLDDGQLAYNATR